MTGWVLALVGISIVGVAAWMAALITAIAVGGRLPPEERAEVPTRLWVALAAAGVTSVVWPLGVLAALAAAAIGLRDSRADRPEGVRRLARAVFATGAAYLGLALAIAAIALGMSAAGG